MEQGGEFIRAVTGSWPVYPGHPLVLATVIMATFADYKSAASPTVHGWCEALGDSRIPGAGDHVTAAMRCLKIGSEGGTAEQMIDYASRYWVRGNAGGHHLKVDAGVRQAADVEAQFRELASTWSFTAECHTA